jgi:SWI/SNF-related matrix-associated actin-dependent regulator 1 of chromatin subfamily A
VKVEENGQNFVLRVPAANKEIIAGLMAYRGLTFSTSASSRQEAVLFAVGNPYALADLADESLPTLGAYRREIDKSRALNGTGTRKLPPGRELWDYQKATLDYLLERKGGINGDSPGLGKTPTSIAYCNEREAQRILVIVPASVRTQWEERIREWSTIPMVKISTMLKVKDGIHPTAHYQIISYEAARNPAIIRAISKYQWDVLICDECLVGDTLIYTEQGMLPIREIVENRLDVRVWSKDLNGNLRLNRINRWVKSSTFDLVETRANRYSLTSTKGHRIYDETDTPTDAGTLRSGDSVRVLRDDFLEAAAISEKSVLQSELLDKSKMGRTGQNGSRSQESTGASDFQRVEGIQQTKDHATEFRSRISRQTKRGIQVAERLTLSSRKRRLRKADTFTTDHSSRVAGLVARMAHGICYIYQAFGRTVSGIADTLQSRSGQSSLEDRSGSGRSRSQVAEGERARCAQGSPFRIARVESVSIHQCRDQQPVPVYDLEVERDHNYIANGFLVSNCHKMKNADALTTRAILGNSRGEYQHGEHKMKAIAHYCKEHLALTGTLLLNRPSECYNLLRFFAHEAIDFASEEKFKNRYNRQADMKTIEGKRFKLESTSLEQELQNRLRVNVMARHEKKDVLTLMKPPRYTIVRCEEDGAVQSALAAEGLLNLSIDEIQTTKDFEILGHIAEARRLMGIALAPQIAEYAKDFLEGSDEKLVIFAWHLQVLDILEDALSRFGTVRIDGRKSAQARQKAVDDFIMRDNVRVFIGNIQAAGTGLDGLQKVCSRCYLAEPDWVPAQNEQAVSRLDRFGQENVVTAEIFVAPGSLSEKILVRALEKMNTIHKVLDAREGN